MLIARIVTGPIGHLVSGAIDVAVGVAQLARARITRWRRRDA